MNETEIQNAVFAAIREVNELLPPEERLAASADTVLFGDGGQLDSLGLVQLIVAVEGKIQEHFDATVTLANERAMARRDNPFHSVASLIRYVGEVLAEEAHVRP